MLQDHSDWWCVCCSRQPIACFGIVPRLLLRTAVLLLSQLIYAVHFHEKLGTRNYPESWKAKRQEPQLLCPVHIMYIWFLLRYLVWTGPLYLSKYKSYSRSNFEHLLSGAESRSQRVVSPIVLGLSWSTCQTDAADSDYQYCIIIGISEKHRYTTSKEPVLLHLSYLTSNIQ